MHILRKAVVQDCPRLMELVQELADYEKAPDEVTVSIEHFEEAGFGPNPVWHAWVVELDGIIQGFALYYIRYSTWKGQRIYLEDLIVTEKMRGKGLGKILFEKILQITRDGGYTGMVWQVLDWNEPAINFYKKYATDFQGGWLNCSISTS